MSILIILTNIVFVWWRIIVIISLIFLTIIDKVESFIIYFILQEILRIIFIIRYLYIERYSNLVLIFILGAPPMHLWVPTLINALNNWLLIWFLTLQKFPTIICLNFIINQSSLLLLIWGIILCIIQILTQKDSKILIFLLSTETTGWIILINYLSIHNILIIFSYYSLFLIYFIPNFLLINKNNRNAEFILRIINIPFRINFLIKFIIIGKLLEYYNIILLSVLLMFFIRVISIIHWLVIYSKSKEILYTKELAILLPLFIIPILF
jgi:hypothetical protein